MPDISVTDEGVRKLLEGLKTSKAAGPDNIHPRVLKEAASEISPILRHIFQKSLDSGQIPTDWRIANICPLYKKGDRSCPTNYRPISLTSIVCKVLEHIVCSNLMRHMDAHNILTDRQHAFRRNHSCVTQLCHVINDWASAIDANQQTDAFILDFAKAFDTVPHERLKSKLHSYGITGKTLNWIDAFLCQRSQRVVVNGAKSKWTRVTSGVPQGTVLGPALFNLFINDITTVVRSEIRLFADDCICYRTILSPSDCNILQQDIENLASWADKWSMKFAPSKCKTIRISRKIRKNIPYLYHLQGVALDSVKEIKYLGVTITHNLRWNKHIADIVSRSNKVLGLLRRNLSFCNQQVKQAAYIGLVRPMLEYASVIWDPHTENLKSEIEKVQRRAARFVTSDYYNFEPGTMTQHLSDLGWKSLRSRRATDTLVLFNRGRLSLSSLPLQHLSAPARQSRHMHSKHLTQPFSRTNVLKYSFIPRALAAWNTLPQSIIDLSDNVNAFEAMLRKCDF